MLLGTLGVNGEHILGHAAINDLPTYTFAL